MAFHLLWQPPTKIGLDAKSNGTVAVCVREQSSTHIVPSSFHYSIVFGVV